MTLKFSRGLEVVHAKFCQVKCSVLCVIGSTNFCLICQWWKIRSCDLDFWPMTLNFSVFRVVVKEHVHAKFHRAKSSGLW